MDDEWVFYVCPCVCARMCMFMCVFWVFSLMQLFISLVWHQFCPIFDFMFMNHLKAICETRVQVYRKCSHTHTSMNTCFPPNHTQVQLFCLHLHGNNILETNKYTYFQMNASNTHTFSLSRLQISHDFFFHYLK